MKKNVMYLLLMLFVFWGSCVAFAEVSQDTVKMVQNKLNELGYECGTPDGIAGQHTKEAVQNYQSDNGLEPSGVIDDKLLDSLGVNNLPDSSNVPGVTVDVFVERYNAAINTYNQIAERDGYEKASTISNLSTNTEDYVLDKKTKSELTLNSGKANSIDKVCSFSFSYWFDESSFNSALMTGEVIACIYAFDDSLPDYRSAGNFYSQLMESNTVSEFNDKETYLYNGDIKYSNNQSATGLFMISAYHENYISAIEPYLLSDEELVQLIKSKQEVAGLSLDTFEDIDKLGKTKKMPRNEFEALYGINFNDLPSAPDSMYEGNEYTLYDCSFLGNPCSVGIAVVSNSLFDNAIWSFDIYFENTPDANDLAKKLTDIFGMEPDDREKDKSYLTWDLEGYWLALSNRKNKPCYISIH